MMQMSPVRSRRFELGRRSDCFASAYATWARQAVAFVFAASNASTSSSGEGVRPLRFALPKGEVHTGSFVDA